MKKALFFAYVLLFCTGCVSRSEFELLKSNHQSLTEKHNKFAEDVIKDITISRNNEVYLEGKIKQLENGSR